MIWGPGILSKRHLKNLKSCWIFWMVYFFVKRFAFPKITGKKTHVEYARYILSWTRVFCSPLPFMGIWMNLTNLIPFPWFPLSFWHERKTISTCFLRFFSSCKNRAHPTRQISSLVRRNCSRIMTSPLSLQQFLSLRTAEATPVATLANHKIAIMETSKPLQLFLDLRKHLSNMYAGKKAPEFQSANPKKSLLKRKVPHCGAMFWTKKAPRTYPPWN